MKRLWAACLLASLAAVGARRAGAAEPAPAWEPAKTWALLVGVLEWEDSASFASFPKEGRLDRALERTLVARGVPASQVRFLEDRAATLAACRAALAEVAAKAGPGSTLLLYYAGHGVRVKRRVWVAPYDMQGDDADATGLGIEEIAGTLRAAWKGSRLLLLADCCHSGDFGRIVARYEGSKDVRACSLTSSLASNLSTGNWTFTEAVIAALEGRGALDADRDGTVAFGEADAHVRREMRFREGQMTEAHRTSSFEPGFVLARVDPASALPRLVGPWQVGDYVEAEWKGDWWRAQVLGAEGEGRRVRYLGYDASSDEVAPPSRLRAPRGLARTRGEAVEIEWKGRWWTGSVTEVRDDFALVHYDDYGAEWDEWVPKKRLRDRR